MSQSLPQLLSSKPNYPRVSEVASSKAVPQGWEMISLTDPETLIQRRWVFENAEEFNRFQDLTRTTKDDLRRDLASTSSSITDPMLFRPSSDWSHGSGDGPTIVRIK